MNEFIKVSVDTSVLSDFLRQSDDTQKEMMLRQNNSEHQALLMKSNLERLQDDLSTSTETTRSHI